LNTQSATGESYAGARSTNLSVKPFGLLSTNRANRARWSRWKTC